ncbi:MAG: WG repeat-containing protein [Clostridiales bacterium]|nr:WG repeat-containing protein [Clostridiales bacterium]
MHKIGMNKKKAQKYILLTIVAITTMLISVSCTTTTYDASKSPPKIFKISEEFIDAPLMLFRDENELFGYVNSETFEIMIPAQYESAGAFVGGFAVVKKKFEPERIINKNDKTIILNFDRVSLHYCEDLKMVFALTENYSGRSVIRYTDQFNCTETRINPSTSNYRLYNLSTGELALDINSKEWSSGNYNAPAIKFYYNYLAYDVDVYEIQSDGSLKESRMNTKQLIAKTVAEKNLKRNRQDFHYSEDSYLDDCFSYVDTFDIDAFIENIPDGMEVASPKTHMQDEKPELLIWPINYDETNPFSASELLYQVVVLEEGQKYESSMPFTGQYTGLYKPSENRWVIPPKIIRSGDKFIQTEHEDWIAYKGARGLGDSQFGYAMFFNIKSNKSSNYLFRLSYNGVLPMIYMGYSGHPEATQAAATFISNDVNQKLASDSSDDDDGSSKAIVERILDGEKRNLIFGGFSWRVLDVRDDMALIITENIIESRPYVNGYRSTTWGTSDLRVYLNGKFFEKFTYEEQEKIIEIQLENPENSQFSVHGGSSTLDKIFLLSLEEADRYFASDNDRMANYYYDSGCDWWLRSPGQYDAAAAVVCDDGQIGFGGVEASSDYIGVRPALWLNLTDSLSFRSPVNAATDE